MPNDLRAAGKYIFWVSRFWKIYWNVNWHWYWQQIYFMLVVMPGVLLLLWNNDEQTIYVDGWSINGDGSETQSMSITSIYKLHQHRHKSTLCKRGKVENRAFCYGANCFLDTRKYIGLDFIQHLKWVNARNFRYLPDAAEIHFSAVKSYTFNGWCCVFVDRNWSFTTFPWFSCLLFARCMMEQDKTNKRQKKSFSIFQSVIVVISKFHWIKQTEFIYLP